jgi:LysM repeat protein
VASQPGATPSGASPSNPEVGRSNDGTQTVSPAAVVNQPGGGPFLAYRVQAGDTVRFIARSYGVSAASIAQASGLRNPDRLQIGQVLTIPSQPGWLYRVQPGETLDQIAARTGVASDLIASASGLSAASVGPGTVVLIPDKTGAQGK